MKKLGRVLSRKTTRANRDHRGFTLLAVLVCLLAISVIVLGGLRQSLRLHRQVRHERMLEQTRWVLDAGMGRAVAALRSDPLYRGETLALETAFQNYQPKVSISVQPGAPDEAKLIEVIALLQPLDSTATDVPFQRSLKFQFIPEDD